MADTALKTEIQIFFFFPPLLLCVWYNMLYYAEVCSLMTNGLSQLLTELGTYLTKNHSDYLFSFLGVLLFCLFVYFLF